MLARGMGEIYCLYSPQDGRPRYVGQTGSQSRARFNQHVTQALRKEPGSLYDWMRGLYAAGSDPDYHVLQEDIIPADLDFYERYWIAQFDNLLNIRVGDTKTVLTTPTGENVIAVIRGKLATQGASGS